MYITPSVPRYNGIHCTDSKLQIIDEQNVTAVRQLMKPTDRLRISGPSPPSVAEVYPSQLHVLEQLKNSICEEGIGGRPYIDAS